MLITVPPLTYKDTKTMTKMTHFTVEGKGRFPLDMLRYDCCWPKTPNDATVMTEHFVEFRSDLCRVSLSAASVNAPTLGRWKSYGWPVVDVVVPR